MPLEVFRRGKIYWFRGRIEELPSSEYYRQSTGKTTEAGAQAVVSNFQRQALRRFYGGEKATLTFSGAVELYNANPEMARDLLKLLDHFADMELASITPKMVGDLGLKIYPLGSTDSWRRHVVTPVRAVINNAHELGHCPPIRIRAFSKSERHRQDRFRGKQSRVEKTPGSWPWLIEFRNEAPKHLAAMALFMFETGARIGQATRIEFDDLDLPNFRIWMPEAKGVDAQWVALTSDLSVELALLRPRVTRRQDGRKLQSDRLFGYLRKDGVYRTWRRVCRDAGIEIIMPHAAGRHGFGTEMLVRQGIDPVTVAKAGRWSDVQMLMERYAHPEDHEARILNAIRTGREQAGGLTSDKEPE